MADARNREAALRELARERELGDSWLSRNSRFLQSGRSLPEGQPEGDALLYQDIRRYMDERGLLDLESTFARTYVSNMNNEYVKVHRVAVARSGLASYRGKVIRDSSLTAGPLAFERRKKHVLARMGLGAGLAAPVREGVDRSLPHGIVRPVRCSQGGARRRWCLHLSGWTS